MHRSFTSSRLGGCLSSLSRPLHPYFKMLGGLSQQPGHLRVLINLLLDRRVVSATAMDICLSS